MKLNDLPPELLIEIFSYLEVNETCFVVQRVCKDFFNTIENFHYWKVVSEFYYFRNFNQNEKRLTEFYEQNQHDWKKVYQYLVENNIFFDETSLLENVKKVLSVSKGGKTIHHHSEKALKDRGSYNWPTIFFNRILEKETVLTLSIKRDKKSTCCVWAFLGICEINDFEFYQRGTDYFGGGSKFENKICNSIGFYFSDLTFYEKGKIECRDGEVRKKEDEEIHTFVINVPKREIRLFISGAFKKKKEFSADPPLRIGLNFPQYSGQRFWIVKTPKLEREKR